MCPPVSSTLSMPQNQSAAQCSHHILRGNVVAKAGRTTGPPHDYYGTGHGAIPLLVWAFFLKQFFRTGNLWNDAAGRWPSRLGVTGYVQHAVPPNDDAERRKLRRGPGDDHLCGIRQRNDLRHAVAGAFINSSLWNSPPCQVPSGIWICLAVVLFYVSLFGREKSGGMKICIISKGLVYFALARQRHLVHYNR